MYRSFDEEVFLAPESVVADAVALAAFADEPELPNVAPFRRFWHVGAAAADEAAAGHEAAPVVRAHAGPVAAWTRHARGANGFGG
jgi:hypothetical protein